MTSNVEQNIPLYPKYDECASQEYAGRLNQLTAREREIFSHLLIGLSNQEIATKLCLTVKTVKNHLTAIYTKLCVKSRSEAIAEYYKTLQRPQIQHPGTPST